MRFLHQKIMYCFMGFAVLNIFTVKYSYAETNSEPTVKEQTKETAQTVKRKSKKGWRKVKDKTCEVVNGKTKCIAQKAKHGVQNTVDKTSDAID
jgi:hypothetical protein